MYNLELSTSKDSFSYAFFRYHRQLCISQLFHLDFTSDVYKICK